MPCSSGISPLPVTHPTGHAMTGGGPPPGVSLASSWSRVAHNGFGSHKSDLGIFIPCSSHAASSRFRYGFRLATHYALPGSCFKKNDKTLFQTPRPCVSTWSFGDLHSFRALPSCHHLVSDLFQSHACGFFSAFAHATCSLSVCSQYLGLGFNAPVFMPCTQTTLLACSYAHCT